MANLTKAIVKPTKNGGSVNNQYDFINGTEPIARYMKTVANRITGERIDPNSRNGEPELQTFLLSSIEDDFQVGCWLGNRYDDDMYWRFNYENDVVELYTDDEVQIFKLRNKLLLKNGTLVEYDNTENGTVFKVPSQEPEVIYEKKAPFEDK